MYVNRGHGLLKSLNLWRVDFGAVTACLIQSDIKGHVQRKLGVPV